MEQPARAAIATPSAVAMSGFAGVEVDLPAAPVAKQRLSRARGAHLARTSDRTTSRRSSGVALTGLRHPKVEREVVLEDLDARVALDGVQESSPRSRVR